MNNVNNPEISNWLTGFYLGTAIFVLIVLGTALYFSSIQTPGLSSLELIAFIFVIGLIESIMIWLTVSIYKMRYTLIDNQLILKAPRLIGGSKRIPLDTIESIQRSLIPFGIRLFGASFFGGHYYFPSVGKAFMVITNFRDGVLIKTKHGNYVITPRNPDVFIEDIRKRM